MNVFKKLNVSAQILSLTALSVLGLMVFGLVSYETLHTVKVNGPLYDRIEADTDLISDITAPGMSLLVPNAIAEEMLGETDPVQVQALVEKERSFSKGV